MPKSEKDIGDEFRRLVTGARERKSRIKMVASEGSGYGSKYVPVLTSNDYSLEEGRSCSKCPPPGRRATAARWPGLPGH